MPHTSIKGHTKKKVKAVLAQISQYSRSKRDFFSQSSYFANDSFANNDTRLYNINRFSVSESYADAFHLRAFCDY